MFCRRGSGGGGHADSALLSLYALLRLVDEGERLNSFLERGNCLTAGRGTSNDASIHWIVVNALLSNFEILLPRYFEAQFFFNQITTQNPKYENPLHASLPLDTDLAISD